MNYINGGYDYIDYVPYPPAGSPPLDTIGAAASNMVISAGNACIAVANAATDAWNYFF